jgi:hypothetical protein
MEATLGPTLHGSRVTLRPGVAEGRTFVPTPSLRARATQDEASVASLGRHRR